MPNFHHSLPENGSYVTAPLSCPTLAESSEDKVSSLYFELPELSKLAKLRMLSQHIWLWNSTKYNSSEIIDRH